MDQDTQPYDDRPTDFDTYTPPLLSVPADIRMIVYEMILMGEDNEIRNPVHMLRPVCHGRSPQSRHPAHALMFANRFLYRELMPLCYTSRLVRIRIPCLNSLEMYARRAAAAAEAKAEATLSTRNTNICLRDTHDQDEKSLVTRHNALPHPPLHLIKKLTICISTPASQDDARRCIDAMRTIAELAGPHTTQLHITFSAMICDGRVSGSEPLLGGDVRAIDERRFVPPDWLPPQDDDATHGEKSDLVVELAGNKALARNVTAFSNLDVLTVVGGLQRTWPDTLDRYLDTALDPVSVSIVGPYYRRGQSMRAKFRRRGCRWSDHDEARSRSTVFIGPKISIAYIMKLLLDGRPHWPLTSGS